MVTLAVLLLLFAAVWCVTLVVARLIR